MCTQNCVNLLVLKCVHGKYVPSKYPCLHSCHLVYAENLPLPGPSRGTKESESPPSGDLKMGALCAPRAPSLISIGIWTGSFFVVGGCPEYCRMFNSIPGFYLLDARTTLLPELRQPKTSPYMAKCPLEAKITREIQCNMLFLPLLDPNQKHQKSQNYMMFTVCQFITYRVTHFTPHKS